MPRVAILILLLFSCLLPANAQIFRYIGTEEGLSSRRVISIEQGSQKYIWVLTHKGVDRYDGKFFTHYKLKREDKEVHFYPDLNQLSIDSDNVLWEYGKDGLVFRFNEMTGAFQFRFDLRQTFPGLTNNPVTAIYHDSQGVFWFCNQNTLVRYNSKQNTTILNEHFLEGEITAIAEGTNNQFFFATSTAIYACTFAGKNVEAIEKNVIPGVQFINYIYRHNESNTLIINTLMNGLFLYDLQTKQVTSLGSAYRDVGVNTIIPYRKHPDEVLIATDGDGIYRLNVRSKKLEHFLKENYQKQNRMNGSIIKDICIDSSGRIWCVIYPTGLTVYSEEYQAYDWIRSNPTNKESLIDNRINAIIQDSDGDIWFATSNGISYYSMKENKWKAYLSEDSKDIHNDNRIFISLCEAKPGLILAGGYMSGTYEINKYTGKVNYTLQPNIAKGIYPDKYIRSIYRDREGLIWRGGYYNLRSYDLNTQITQLYHTNYPITCIQRKNDDFLWIGTINGLYTFNMITKQMQEYPFISSTGCINAIYQTENDSLTYVATYGNGLNIINNTTRKCEIFHKDNCGLISNNIYSIVPSNDGNIFLGTENGLAFFDVTKKTATQWTKEQGLLASSFNQNAVAKTNNGNLIFGTNEGAIVIPGDMKLPRQFSSHMVLENLHIMYRTAHPNMPGSPLTKLLDDTETLHLKYNQNTFSLNVNSINYGNPSGLAYRWKLEGFYDEWTEASHDNLICYTNLSPGNYTLKIRAYLLDNNQFIEERSIQIIVDKPFWRTAWAYLVYLLIVVGIIYALKRWIAIGKDRRDSQQKINFFMQTAHDIRTPLTLIKAPLGEILKKERLSEAGLTNLNLAIQNTDNLSELASNLMNFQKEELYSSKLNVEEVELNQYLHDYLKHFESYASQKGLQLDYRCSFPTLKVWLDRNKMDSILRNLLTNALKYTPKGGKVMLEAGYNKNNWYLTITDTGIGIPKQDQRKLFRFLFRGQNATNQLITGSGVGMLLTNRLIHNHQGKITFTSKENTGTSFHLTFPLKSPRYHYMKQQHTTTNDALTANLQQDHGSILWEETDAHITPPAHAPYILIVEDNTPLRIFLKQSLSDTYVTVTATNGADALAKIKEHQPDLIISDVMMPIMNGHELCKQVKENVETSHIPIILLTALGSKEEILSGLECKADQYIVKPFDLTMLRANICNMLENRNQLRQKLQKNIIAHLKHDGQLINHSSEQSSNPDDEFISQVTQMIKEGLSKGLNVDTLCASFNMSRTSFYHKIKDLTGLAPAELIRNIRMEEATTLLKSRRYSVAEVSALLGFADPKYFTDTFKKQYGVTPSVYMKREKALNKIDQELNNEQQATRKVGEEQVSIEIVDITKNKTSDKVNKNDK